MLALSDLSDNLLIDTPENVLLDAEIAGFGSRCVASIIDYIILLILIVIVAYVYLRAMSNNQYAGLALIGLVYILITFYHLFFEFVWNGQTPGKRVFGLRVVQTNGLPVTTSSIIIRNLVRLFDFFPLMYGIGLISMFATEHTQRLGDLAAKTFVIREQKNITLDNVRESYVVQYHHIQKNSEIPPYIHVELLGENDRRDIVEYLQRRYNLHRREYVVGPLAQRVARKIGQDAFAEASRSPRDAEKFLEQVALAFEQAQQAAAS